MLGSSRTSLVSLQERLTSVYEDETLTPFRHEAGTGLLQIADAASSERMLRQVWADPATSDQVKDGILNQVFGQHVPLLSLDLAKGVINSRWSNESDMLDALEEAGSSLLFMAAEADGDLDQVEGELFEFRRTVESSADLQMALTNPASSSESKVGLVTQLLQGKANPITVELVSHLAGHLRGRPMNKALAALSSLAAVRRDEVVADVRSAVPLTAEQTERLAQALSRQHGRKVIVNVTVDPATMGGIEVSIGDEVLDGTLANRIEQARRRLAS